MQTQIITRGHSGPIIIWLTSLFRGDEIEKTVAHLDDLAQGRPFTLATVIIEDWNNQLSPWHAVCDGTEFGGGGEETLKWLTDEFTPSLRESYPDAEQVFIAGYSLAGLFALWAQYETGLFDGAASCSGSLWYPGWEEYIREHQVPRDSHVFLSLGGKEKKSRSPLVSRVEDMTRLQLELLKRANISCTLEMNPGGHFSNPDLRIAKGMAWLLSQPRKNTMKYTIDAQENIQFMAEMRENLFAFGKKFPAPTGSSYYLGDDGTPWTDRPRETWITSRMAHVYSIGSMLGFEGSEALVDAALTGLKEELHDHTHGGWYAGVTASGEVLPNKQCYAHAFVILAATSAMLAGRPGAEELLEEALATYDEKFWDEEAGLAYDTWNTEFTVLDEYRGINSNMHTVEAFLAVADAVKDGEISRKYRARAGRIIEHVVGWASANNWRIPEHFTSDWQPDLECNKDKPADPFKPFGATPGHGIEWARLITQWAVSVEADGKYIEAAENLYNTAIRDGWNADGELGLVYTTDWEGKPVVHDRMHWTLAEAINTSAVLYRVTGSEKYAKDYSMFMEYLDAKVLDHKHGSWFHQLNEKNELIGTVWPGKSDIYHALQATLIPYQRVDVSVAMGKRL